MRKLISLIFLFAVCALVQGQEVGVPQGATKVPVAAQTCTGTDKISAVASDGVVTCSADEGGAGGGDNITVNSSEVADANLKDSAQVAFALDSVPTPDDITATIVAGSISATELGTDSVSADELNATGVEAELEAVLDLESLQGAVTDAQVPNNITIDLATTATTANAGDSATLFFGSGTIEDARLSANVSLLGSSIGSGEVDAGSIDSGELATANKTITKTINIFDPTTGDTNLVQIYWPAAVTLVRVSCSIDAGTSVTIQLDERAEATPNTAGTDSLTSALVCDTDSQVTTIFSDAGIAIDVPHNLQITGVVGTVGVVRIHVKATVN